MFNNECPGKSLSGGMKINKNILEEVRKNNVASIISLHIRGNQVNRGK